ncbi:MAG: type II toxin-antitoxin system RelE family toxin [Candidatus Binataceae bacterium]
MEQDPRGGDVLRLHPVSGLPAFRRRVGDYRILFDLYPERNLILVSDIVRRTTTTYRGRR